MTAVLQQPVLVWQLPPDMAAVVQRWVRESLSAVEIQSADVPHGTVLLRTGGAWDSLLGFANRSGGLLTPLVVFKNPVPVWQSSMVVPNGEIPQTDWPRLRRTLLIHNPGLGGFFSLVDQAISST